MHSSLHSSFWMSASICSGVVLEPYRCTTLPSRSTWQSHGNQAPVTLVRELDALFTAHMHRTRASQHKERGRTRNLVKFCAARHSLGSG